MFVIFGSRKQGVKKIGYKNTHCKNCKMPRICIQWGWFSWGHVFFIPFIPLGHEHKWECSACSLEPAVHRETGLPLKVFVLLIVGLFSYVLFVNPGDIEPKLEWALRGISVASIVGLTYSIVFHFKNLAKKAAKGLLPLDDVENCKLCGGKLLGSPNLQCQDCNAKVYEPGNVLQDLHGASARKLA